MNAVLKQPMSLEADEDLVPLTPQQHNRSLLRSAQQGGMVQFNGRRLAMQAIAFQQDGCDVSASVYLQGVMGSIDGKDVQPVGVPDADGCEDAERQSILLHCLQTAHPVTHRDLHCFVHTLRLDLQDGGLLSTVYITGKAKPVPIEEITRQPRPPAVLQLAAVSPEPKN